MTAMIPITSESEAQRCANLWRAVLSAALLDYRKEWVKAKTPEAKLRVEKNARFYLTSKDGRDVMLRAGMMLNDRAVAHAIAEITADPKQSVLDPFQRVNGFRRIWGDGYENVGVTW